jgi:hypothetical protein
MPDTPVCNSFWTRLILMFRLQMVSQFLDLSDYFVPGFLQNTPLCLCKCLL